MYSIADLAQLIYDLKQVNPRARICVKLVAEAGVGTIAAGVAKAHADIILISGHEGGTGASPLSSIKSAGSAWELGIAEAQQVLMLNGLRNRVTLRTDGGMRTGTDIVQAAILGAEEYNFGTIALIAAGCVYVRQCHLNTCPVGVATQDERLRAKFKGTPENVINFFNGVATEVGEVGYQYGEAGLPDGTLELKLSGTAGQSLGAFLTSGIRVVLEGEANDYVGKSMSGGEIIVRPPADRKSVAHENSIIGNTVMY